MTDRAREAAEERQKERRRDRERRIGALISGADPKRLNNRQRLNAALVLTRYVEQAIKKTSKDLVIQALQKVDGKGHSNTFRIDRWKLPEAIQQIGEAETKAFADKPYPLRTTVKFFRFIGSLAEQLGLPAFDGQSEMLEATGLEHTPPNYPPGVQDDDYLPERRLADLLDDFAAAMARCHDLSSLWLRAERIQAGWDPVVGPSAAFFELEEHFGANKPISESCWYPGRLPPCPSVSIGKIPFASVSETFVLAPTEPGEPEEAIRGEAVAWWRMNLMIGPGGLNRVSAFIWWDSHVTLSLEDGSLRNAPAHDGYPDLYAFCGPDPYARVEHSGVSRPVSFTPEVSECLRRDNEHDWKTARRLFGERYPELERDKDMPQSFDPALMVKPVSPGIVRRWFVQNPGLTPKDLRPEEHFEACAEEIRVHTERTLFSRPQTLAWAVEAALHQGLLEPRVAAWVEAYEPSLTTFERNWREQAERDADELRTRWRNEDQKHMSARPAAERE